MGHVRGRRRRLENDSPLTRADLDAAYVGVYGMASAGGCTALYGELGIDAALAEIEQEGAITRPQVEAPIGAFVACAESDQPFTLRVYTADRELLHEHHQHALDLSRYASRLAALRRDSDRHSTGSAIRTRSIWTVRSADGTESEWEY
jgi:hypothetical protein